MRAVHIVVGAALIAMVIYATHYLHAPPKDNSGPPFKIDRVASLPTHQQWCPNPSTPFPMTTPFPVNFWYVKTYKTGSTTLSSVFNSICQHYGVVWLKWDEMKVVFQLSDKGTKPTPYQVGMKNAIDKVFNSSDFNYVAITSHIPYSEQAAELIQQPLMRFTSVRHPVARVHSHFIQTLCFWTAVRMGWKPFAPLNTSGPPGPSACDSGDDSTYMQLATANDTVEHRYDFAKKHFQQNLMYWYIRGDARTVEDAADQYDFIFVSERMNEGESAQAVQANTAAAAPKAAAASGNGSVEAAVSRTCQHQLLVSCTHIQFSCSLGRAA